MCRHPNIGLDEDALEEIHLAWVDNPVSIYFMKHRSLICYARDLKTITDVTRDYSKNHNCIKKAVLDVILLNMG